MANFDIAYAPMLQHEGGYANNPHDTGGETYKGIARNHHPRWDGWRYVDRVKQTLINPPPYGTREWGNWRGFLDRQLAGVPSLQEMVKNFYRANFWATIRGDEIQDQSIATWLFDRGVNCGTGAAAKMLQRACGVTADGEIGSKTIAACNGSDYPALLERMREEARSYYRDIVNHHPDQAEFLDGWLARV